MKKLLLTSVLLLTPTVAHAAPVLPLMPGSNNVAPSENAIERPFILNVTGSEQDDIEKHLANAEGREGRAGLINSSLINALTLDEYTLLALTKPFILPAQGVFTSPFGDRDLGDGNGMQLHAGQDIANKIGTPIYAAADGTVVVRESHASAGNYIIVRHVIDGVALNTRYLHLDKFNIELGAIVKQGDQIGEMGTTGYSTGSHLHFEVRAGAGNYDDTPLEPMRFVKR